MAHDTRIGALLVDAGDISAEELTQALHIQRTSNDRLGTILLSRTRINPFRLYTLLAQQQSLPLANLEQPHPQPNLLSYALMNDYISLRCIPWQSDGERVTLACCEVTDALRQWAAQHFTQPIRYVLATPRDIRQALAQAFQHQISDDTHHRLHRQRPELSAFTTITNMQRAILLGFLLTFALLMVFATYPTLVTTLILANLFYVITIGLRIMLYVASPARKTAPLQDTPAEELPLYSILIPLYKEQDNISHILNAIRNLDYPASRLDVKLVVEADDTMTIEAIKRARPEPYFEIIRVPYSQPRTKPKACNYALAFARGDYVTIYDAEDLPEPQQLKKAIATFAAAPKDVICLQARLNYYNWRESTLSKLFAIEYACLFDVILPALQRLNIPIPLGGTSNHINLTRLREIGEWDPYNVTEDADLGMRLCMLGYRTQILNSITLEEAPITFRAWLKQRSRWIKGYMQTWLVYMRHPITLYQQISHRGFWGFQFFIGGPCVVFVASPILWILTIIWQMDYIPIQALPQWLINICMSVLLLGGVCHLAYAAHVVRRWKWPHMGFIILLFPFYWLLHSIASIKALWQLIFKPHFWEKTAHGLTKLDSVAIMASMRQLSPQNAIITVDTTASES